MTDNDSNLSLNIQYPKDANGNTPVDLIKNTPTEVLFESYAYNQNKNKQTTEDENK